MNRGEIEKVVRDSYDCRRTGDVESTLQCFHPEATFRIVGPERLKPLTEQVSGQVALRAMFENVFPVWDWSNFTIDSVHIDGDTVFVRSSGKLVHVPSGRVLDTEILDQITMKDGLIAGFTEFVDNHLLAQTVGLI